MTNKEYSDFLIPNVKHDYEYYEKLYPERNLKEGAMVTRFAPSPTGFVHVGHLYTSFACIQLAKQTNGIVYLRIEDTDQKREVENGIQGIIDDFDSLGLSFDEGPTQGGNYGPYIQSERGDIYRAFAKKLIEEDKAYPCFCSNEDIENIRKEQERNKDRIGYYGKWAKCRALSKEEIIEKVNNHESYIIRLRSNGDFNNKVVLNDCIKGKIEFPENDLDIVIIKSDGLPTYHFAHAIDDHLMRTTHVMRGDEWVASYPIHEQLFKLLKFKQPKYAHIAPISVREGNTVRKLSKRKDKEAAISYYHKLGIPTEVIRLYLATINNSNFEMWYQQNPTLTIDDYKFTFDKMPVGNSLFDIDKLLNISKIYFSSLKATEVYNGLLKHTQEFDNDFYNIISKYKEYTISILNIEREQQKPRKDFYSYSDIKNYIWYMYDELFVNHNYAWQTISDKEEIRHLLDLYINKYYDSNDDKETWFNKIKLLCDELGYASDMKAYKENKEKYKGSVADVSMVIRVALTTKSMTADLYEIMKLLGTDKIKERIKKVF